MKIKIRKSEPCSTVFTSGAAVFLCIPLKNIPKFPSFWPTYVLDNDYLTSDNRVVLNMIALQEAMKGRLFSKKNCLVNIVPGIIVGIVALPLAMAFAIASGGSPEKGLYTAIVAGFCVSVFGGTRVQIAGPTGAFVILLSRIVQEHGFEGLQLATLLAGISLILTGLLYP